MLLDIGKIPRCKGFICGGIIVKQDGNTEVKWEYSSDSSNLDSMCVEETGSYHMLRIDKVLLMFLVDAQTTISSGMHAFTNVGYLIPSLQP